MPGGHHPRSAVERRSEVVPVAQLCLPGPNAHPQLHPTPCRDRSIDSRPRPGERGNHALTGVAEQKPSCTSIEERNTSSCAIRALRIASAADSHRRVDPSISVNTNVTTPEGGPPADTRAARLMQRFETIPAPLEPCPQTLGGGRLSGYRSGVVSAD